MINSRWWRAIICLSSVALWLPACNSPEHCTLVPGIRYEGDGVLVLRQNVAQDGSLFVLFYPVCHLDTLHLLYALQQAPEGFSIRLRQREVIDAIHHRAVVLQDLDKRRREKDPRYYVTSVHLAYTLAPERMYGHRPALPWLLDTKQARIEHPVHVLDGGVRPRAFYGI